MSPALDLLTFGETMVLFAPSERGTLESTAAYHAAIGGAESNCAIGLARLGYSVAWVSRLGRDPFGARGTQDDSWGGRRCQSSPDMRLGADWPHV